MAEDTKSKGHNGVTGLPQDVLLAVLRHTEFQSLLHATHVCRRWRETALSFPAALWSDIRSSCRIPGALLAQLERAQNAPVSINISTQSPYEHLVAEAMMAIVAHIHHVKSLSIDITHHDMMIDEDERLPLDYYAMHYLSTVPAAPILKTLSLTLMFFLPDEDDWSPQPVARLPSNIFGGSAPVLSYVVLKGMIQLPTQCPAFATAVSLEVSTLNATSKQITALDVVFPALESLDLTIEHELRLPSQRSSLKLAKLIVRPPPWTEDSAALLRHFPCEAAQHVGFVWFAGWFDVLWPPETRNKVAPFTLSKENRNMVWIIRDGTGRTVTVNNVPRGATVPPGLQDNLVESF
ncbi:hypothetical protein EXIGLDRAFT_775708 [Exidia glandulosa HHB12029]|uniref:F-box domain-containing protein n=1 Tax=Exidia glandulosa HHB12029 TaxID=1314781 RepID=A0A165DSU6_EXIGL|nr:hypothetical protein EXIGLDRAFT_775708 [Exidia glandulosa HHB12029]